MEHSQVAGGQLASLMGKVDVDNLKMTSSLLVRKEGDTACSKRLTLAWDCHQTSK